MKRFLAFIIKEFIHVLRDPKTLLLLIGLPIVQILLFGFALSNEIKEAHIVVVDHDGGVQAQELVARLDASTHFEVDRILSSDAEVDAAFKAGGIKLAVNLPLGLFTRPQREGVDAVQLIADASDPNTATALINFATLIIRQHFSERTAGVPMGIEAETRMLYNPELRSAPNFVPGVMALVVMLVCVLMTSVSIVREKERGTMEVLLVSPFDPMMVIVSKALPYLILSLLNMVLILLLSVYVLDTPVKGSLILLFAESGLLIATSLSLGLLISNVTDSQQTAMLISLMGLMVPTMLFTGFMFPLENMPVALQWISRVVPSRWFYSIVKAIMIKGLGIEAIWKETLILVGMTVFLLILSFKRFKRRLA